MGDYQVEEKNYNEVKKNQESKSDSKELDETDDRPIKKRKLNNEDMTDDEENQEVVSIDAMFDDAELELRTKVKRRLEKLGVDIDKTVEWTTKKKKKKSKKKKDPAIIKEFDFTSENMHDNLIEGLDRAKTMNDVENL